jgi:hypothetical protein
MVELNPEVHWWIVISNPDAESDSDPDPEDYWLMLPHSNGSPERLSLSGSHGQRPLVLG